MDHSHGININKGEKNLSLLEAHPFFVAILFFLIIGVDSGHFLFELNDRQNSRFVYTTLKSYHKASAQVLSNLRSSSSGFSWTTDTHISPGFLLSWSFDPRSFDPNSVGFLSIFSNIIDSGIKLNWVEILLLFLGACWFFLK